MISVEVLQMTTNNCSAEIIHKTWKMFMQRAITCQSHSKPVEAKDGALDDSDCMLFQNGFRRDNT